MDKLYTIGETAKLNDISIKSLRHYDEIGLLKPFYIDDQSGYRYYTYSQFAFIDKIKRYKNVGMQLKDLKEIFESQNLESIELLLKERRQAIDEQARLLEDMKENVRWLMDFFEYSKSMQVESSITIKELPERYVISAPCNEGDSIYDMDLALRKLLSLPVFKNTQILNLYGYILDFDKLMENKMLARYSTVSIRDLPAERNPYTRTIPAGTYLCYKANILSDDWDISPLIRYCQQHSVRKPFAVAFEYLTKLHDPQQSPYEITILL